MPALALIPAAVSVIGGIASAAKGSGPGTGPQGNLGQDKQNWQNYDKQQQDVNAAQINTAGASPFVGAEKGLMGQLQGQAAGQGPSLAEAQLQKGQQANLAGALAATAAQGGNQNPGVMQQNMLGRLADVNQDAAGQAAQARAGEQLSAQQQLGALSTQGASQQYQLGQAQAGLNQQAAMGNQLAQQRAQAQWNQAVAGLTNTSQQGQNMLAGQDNAMSNSWQNAALGSAASGAGGALAGFGSSGGTGVGSAMQDAADSGYGMKGAAQGGLLLSPTIAGEAGPEFAVPAVSTPTNDMSLAARLGPAGITILHDRVSRLEEAMQRLRGAGRI